MLAGFDQAMLQKLQSRDVNPRPEINTSRPRRVMTRESSPKENDDGSLLLLLKKPTNCLSKESQSIMVLSTLSQSSSPFEKGPKLKGRSGGATCCLYWT